MAKETERDYVPSADETQSGEGTTDGDAGERTKANHRTDAMRQEEVDMVIASAPAIRRRGPFYAFQFRNFRLFFYGQLISVAGTWMQMVAQQWLIWDLTHQERWLGIVSGASAIPYVLFAVAGGQVADRYPRRVTLVITQTVSMLLAFVLAWLTFGRGGVHVQAWHVAVLAGLLGIVNAYNMPSQQAFVTDMVDDREALGNAIALNSLRFNIARVLGPIFAGGVLVKAGAASCFFYNGMSYIAVIISLLMMRLPRFTPAKKRESIWGGFRYIAEEVSVLRVVTLVGAASLMAWSVSTLFPAIAASYHRGATGFSSIMVANGVGAMLGGVALTLINERISRRLLVYGGAFLFGVFLLLLSLATSFYLALACLVGSGFWMIIFGISANTKVQSDVPDALRGRVMAVYSLVFGGLMPMGGLGMGFLAQHLTSAWAVRINATLFIVVTLLLGLSSVRNPARKIVLSEEELSDQD